MKQFLIALDQVLNTMVYAKYEGFGFADETVSARAWRLKRAPSWSKIRQLIDVVFGEDHCYRAYKAECDRMQLPTKYCADQND